MKKLLAALLVAGIPLSATAMEEPITPGEFREFAEGWTLYFERDGEAFGSESFEPGGETRWRFRDGSCVSGKWRPYGAQVCFLYDSEVENEVLCWRMLRDEQGLLARLLKGESAGLELRITGRDKKPLLCGAPAEGA